MAHLYYTVLYYTTLPYLSIYTFTRTGNPVCYLPTYLPLKCKYGMVWYGRWQMDIVNFQGHVVSQMITSSISLSVPSNFLPVLPDHSLLQATTNKSCLLPKGQVR